MKVLITGGTSVLGRSLKRVLGRDCEVVTAGRDDSSDFRIDLLNRDSFRGIDIDYDAVVHCAAAFYGDSADGMIQNELLNSLGSLYVAENAATAGCRHFIYISTIFSLRHNDNAYFGSYGISKQHGQDNVSQLCSARDMLFTSMAAGPLYDIAGNERKHQPLFYHIIDRAENGKDIHFFGNLDPIRNYLLIDDFAEMIGIVVRQRIGGAFNCVHPDSYKLSEIAELAYDVYGNGGEALFLKDRPDLPAMYIPSATDTFETLKYTPGTSLREGIEMIREFRENR